MDDIRGQFLKRLFLEVVSLASSTVLDSADSRVSYETSGEKISSSCMCSVSCHNKNVNKKLIKSSAVYIYKCFDGLIL